MDDSEYANPNLQRRGSSPFALLLPHYRQLEIAAAFCCCITMETQA